MPCRTRRKRDCHRQPVGCCSSGFANDEEMPLHRALETTQQIAQSMDVTVSLDYNGGYVFSSGIWWIGFKMNRSGSDVQVLQMYS
jgi:hypothetical protein